MSKIELFELSFADTLTAIDQAQDLSQSHKAHWSCSLRQIAAWMDRPVESIPARLTSIRIPMDKLHHERLGVTAKTVANHKSNVRAALRWIGQEKGLPGRGAPLMPAWARLKDAVNDKGRRARLYGLMRYCSAKAVLPPAMNDAVLDRYMRYRANATSLAANAMAVRSVARAWNQCRQTIECWPPVELTEPPLAVANRVAWEEFPEGLRRDIERYLATFEKTRRGRNGKRIRANKSSSLRTRRAEFVAFARKAVSIGIDINTLTSLAKLVHPDVVEKVIEAYWGDDEDPTVYVIDMAWKILRAAAATGGIDETGLTRLDEIRADLDHYRRVGLTPKNLTLVRQVLTEGVWREVVGLPQVLMKQARSLLHHAPVKAAVTAQLAVAIAILTFAPVRLANLVSIKLGENLIKPGGPDSTYFLTFPRYDVKNRVDLEFPLDRDLTDLIDEYVHDFRSILQRGSNLPNLFPGEAGGKGKTTLSEQITKRVQKALGLRITVHQFRHAAAAIFLKNRPGEYETVRRLLGHKNIQTTINFYCGLQTTQATEQFAKIVRAEMVLESE